MSFLNIGNDRVIFIDEWLDYLKCQTHTSYNIREDNNNIYFIKKIKYGKVVCCKACVYCNLNNTLWISHDVINDILLLDYHFKPPVSDVLQVISYRIGLKFNMKVIVHVL